MTLDIALTLLIILLALILFAIDKLRVDVIALLVLIAVGALGLIPREELFAGFANSAVITVWAVYMVSGGMFKTGVADMMGSAILKVAGEGEARLVATIMLTVGVLSAFMNNVGATAMLMPAVVGISRKTNIPVSKLLIPLAFASLLGGKMTLIGTPANILGAGILDSRGMESFGFFEFTPIGIVLLATGTLYMVFIGRHLLPDREAGISEDDVYALRDYVTELRLPSTSPLVGRTLFESRLNQDYGLTVLTIRRTDGEKPLVNRDTILRAGDRIIVEAAASDLIKARNRLGLIPRTDQDIEIENLEYGAVQVIEATLAPNSQIGGLTLQDINLREKYGYTALAISRFGEVISGNLRKEPLQFGDALLLQGPLHRAEELQQGQDFIVLEPLEMETQRRGKAPIAVGALLAAILLTIFAGVEISLAMVIAAMIMILSGALTVEEAYESVDWRTVFLVAGMLSLGAAMEATGAARYLADVMLGIFGPWGPMATLAGIYLLAALITQPMSNAAAIVLIVPIAIDIAAGVGASHKTFTMAVIVGAATSFLSPVGHKANVLVFGPGGYKFMDFTKVGILLTVVLLVVSMIFLPLIWPLFP
ncbi:MAG: SLC13 family permease [Anaerolineales bacterium]